MNKTYEFVLRNFKIIVSIIVFIIGLYVQHQLNTERISTLEDKYKEMNIKLDAQYQKMDAIKLDKTVFEASIKQFQTMSDDIREIRNDIKEVLKSK